MKFVVTNYASSARGVAGSQDCVTTQMTLDARGTGMTLTGSARARRIN